MQVQRLKGFVRHFSRQPRRTIAIAQLDLTQGAGGYGGRRCGCCIAAAQESTFATRCSRYIPSVHTGEVCHSICRLLALPLDVQQSRTDRKRKRQNRQIPDRAAAGSGPEAQDSVAAPASHPAVTAGGASVQPSTVPAVDAPGPAATAHTDIECGSAPVSTEAAAAGGAGGAPACSSALDMLPPAPAMQQGAEDANSRRDSGDGCDTGAGDADGESSDSGDEAAGDQPPVSASL